MEGIKEDVNYSDHESKCRICFKAFGSDERQVVVTKVVVRRFQEITEKKLVLLDNFSRKICVVCNFQLRDFCVFKRNVVLLQNGLFRFVGRNKTFKTESEDLKDGFSNKTEEYLDDEDFKAEDENTSDQNPNGTEFLDFSGDLNFDRSPHHDSQSDFEMDEEENEHEPRTNIAHSKTFDCAECFVEFESHQSLQSHKQMMHSSSKDRTKWICTQCNTSFSGSRSLRDHITVTHSSIKPQIPCPVKSCSKVFLTTKRLRAHTKVHDDDSKEMCPECGLLLTSKHNLQKHIKRVHLKLRNFFCDICGYSATFRHSIAAHMVSHVDPNERRKWKCDLCNFVSVSKQSLRSHKSYEHSGKVYTCHCGKQFNQRASLTTHIKCVHHKIKDHLCTICGKAYFSRNDLKHHKKSQHADKDMPCEICGKLFATQKHLTRHRMYHVEPKFKCNFEGCQKAFIDNAKLKDHMKLHENNRDHLCHLCEKSYFHQKDLKRHLDVAHKATIFYCELCEFTISRKDYLRNHLNSAHKNLTVEEKNEILARTKVTRNAV